MERESSVQTREHFFPLMQGTALACQFPAGCMGPLVFRLRFLGGPVCCAVWETGPGTTSESTEDGRQEKRANF